MSEERRHMALGPITLPRISIPNPLAWVSRPRLLGGRPRTKQSNTLASTSAAISESMLGSGSASSAVSTAVTSAAGGTSKVALKPASDVLCGAIARAASQSTIHPLDTFKVRLQARSRINIASASAAPSLQAPPPGMSKIGQLMPPVISGQRVGVDMKELGKGVASLYRGVFGAASGAGIAIGAYFAVYGVACNMLSTQTDLPPSGVAFVGGAIAAVGSSVVKVPLAVCIRSVQAGVYPNAFAACRSIVSAAGVRGLFTGFLPTVLEDVPDMAIKFAAYETMRQVHSKFHKGRVASPQEDFAMGAVAGAAAAAATTPLDVIKTNMMCSAASRPSMSAAMRHVASQGGARAFFRGIGPRALSNGINSAVFFAFFEALRTTVAANKARQLALLQAGAVPCAVPAATTLGGSTRPPMHRMPMPVTPLVVEQYEAQQAMALASATVRPK
mmetsp:Transcript_13587/g.23888  ORF Transcript_13587/g.23888 Transcript_13587/m.23888 type:complete len:445 (-) Transcript_13587:491-1825(-)|eukprot:CAMPEP_0119107800 /NCGR_PEP_ID=MMETSP1180-20130426/11607_1 /TAXON_ID=3052 ORGANISM="Chlamydomonas cf sp, Strain CCMP681" /NCGR_SAMPLE_ID=MMETSP1180 /ASSEMBLY_ACC=CAM_ASM_000741 /LENGTH=444 /DNA_ID=CAMNT_0007093341 /DNA_START=831 /DNA_END=2165 /DNA_ORIENTATION=+